MSQTPAETAYAVFLDRDGTLIEDCGHLRDPGKVVFYPDTIASLKRLQERFRLFIVTHQAGVGQGLIAPDEAERLNQCVVRRLREAGVWITEVYCCPHRREDGCRCVQPHPFSLEQAARAYRLDLRRSFVVGDHPHDVQFAEIAGSVGLYVLSGHGDKHRGELPAGKLVLPGIREAVDWILACADMWQKEECCPGQVQEAAGLLRCGGIVAFPTETVYGLGAAVFNESAVARVFEAKQRPRFDPLIVHVSDFQQVSLLVKAIPPSARRLMERFWPGPLTVVLPKAPEVPDLVTAGLPTVAVRMPRHPLALELIRRARVPVAAPSANPFGTPSPTTAQHVVDGLGGKVDLVLDGGPCAVGVESTIVSFAAGEPVLLRWGGVPVEEIESLLGPLPFAPAAGDNTVAAPGMLPKHYAPRTRMHVVSGPIPPPQDGTLRVGALAFRGIEQAEAFAAVEVLSETGDLREAARHLFGALLRLDKQDLDLIVAQRVPDIGLGLAINDRLMRAAGCGEMACGRNLKQDRKPMADEAARQLPAEATVGPESVPL